MSFEKKRGRFFAVARYCWANIFHHYYVIVGLEIDNSNLTRCFKAVIVNNLAKYILIIKIVSRNEFEIKLVSWMGRSNLVLNALTKLLSWSNPAKCLWSKGNKANKHIHAQKSPTSRQIDSLFNKFLPQWLLYTIFCWLFLFGKLNFWWITIDAKRNKTNWLVVEFSEIRMKQTATTKNQIEQKRGKRQRANDLLRIVLFSPSSCWFVLDTSYNIIIIIITALAICIRIIWQNWWHSQKLEHKMSFVFTFRWWMLVFS